MFPLCGLVQQSHEAQMRYILKVRVTVAAFDQLYIGRWNVKAIRSHVGSRHYASITKHGELNAIAARVRAVFRMIIFGQYRH
jgi:hypothetical protein